MKKKVIIGIILVLVIGALLYFILKPSKITISFDVNGGSKVSDIEIVKGNKIELPNVKKDGYDFIGWYIGDKKVKDNYIYNESVKLKAKWEMVVTYKVSFETYGGTNVEDIVLREGTALKLPENPIKEDYNFLGWKNENGEFIENNILVDRDIVLYAEWEYKYYCDDGYKLEDKKCIKNLSLEPSVNYKCPDGYRGGGRKGFCFGEYKKVSLSEMICDDDSNPIPDSNGRCYKEKNELDKVECDKNNWYFYDGICYQRFTYVICKNNESTTLISESEDGSVIGYYCGGKYITGDISYVCPSGYNLSNKICYKTIVEDAKIK